MAYIIFNTGLVTVKDTMYDLKSKPYRLTVREEGDDDALRISNHGYSNHGNQGTYPGYHSYYGYHGNQGTYHGYCGYHVNLTVGEEGDDNALRLSLVVNQNITLSIIR